jgi:hypothetical protein
MWDRKEVEGRVESQGWTFKDHIVRFLTKNRISTRVRRALLREGVAKLHMLRDRSVLRCECPMCMVGSLRKRNGEWAGHSQHGIWRWRLLESAEHRSGRSRKCNVIVRFLTKNRIRRSGGLALAESIRLIRLFVLRFFVAPAVCRSRCGSPVVAH